MEQSINSQPALQHNKQMKNGKVLPLAADATNNEYFTDFGSFISNYGVCNKNLNWEGVSVLSIRGFVAVPCTEMFQRTYLVLIFIYLCKYQLQEARKNCMMMSFIILLMKLLGRTRLRWGEQVEKWKRIEMHTEFVDCGLGQGLILKMEAVHCSETLVTTYDTNRIIFSALRT